MHVPDVDPFESRLKGKLSLEREGVGIVVSDDLARSGGSEERLREEVPD